MRRLAQITRAIARNALLAGRAEPLECWRAFINLPHFCRGEAVPSEDATPSARARLPSSKKMHAARLEDTLPQVVGRRRRFLHSGIQAPDRAVGVWRAQTPPKESGRTVASRVVHKLAQPAWMTCVQSRRAGSETAYRLTSCAGNISVTCRAARTLMTSARPD